jgi:uncharacterized protein (TIGR02677 family)
MARADDAPVVPAAERIVVDERLDLLRWVAAPERSTYLAILHVFDEAKAGYDVQLRPNDVLAALARAGHEVEPDSLGRFLDSLHQWRVLERSFDASRVSSIEEYRRRRPVFQFTELGERAYRGVRELLDAQPGEGRLQRFALREIAEQLELLHRAASVADGERALAALNRVDLVLTQLADRAGQFYVLVGVMTQEVEVNAGRFVEMKDLLLGHLHEFLQDLHRWTPVVQQHVAAIERLGVKELLRLVADADDAVFQTIEQRRSAWGRRWEGLLAWFAPPHDGHLSQVIQLDRRTVAAIRELTALLRRLVEADGRGAGRATELVGLARWFWALDGRGPEAAHAVYDVMFPFGGSLHLGTGYDDDELVTAQTPWGDADPVPVSISLRERGQHAAPGTGAAIPDDRRAREALRAMARERIDAEARAARRLAQLGLGGRTLERDEFDQLLRFTDLALAAGVPVAGEVRTGAIGDVRVSIRPGDVDTVVGVVDGTFVLRGVSVTVELV